MEVKLDSGDDRSDVWGPGLAVLYGGQIMNLVCNPSHGTYSASGRRGSRFNPSKPCLLRVRIDKDMLFFEASQDDAPFAVIAMLPANRTPDAVRVGKVGSSGTVGTDDRANRNLVRMHVQQVIFRGSATEKPPATAARTDLPDIDIHYEIYDGIPLFSKWLVLKNKGKSVLRVNRFTAEELRLVETEPRPAPLRDYPNIHVETDYAFDGMDSNDADNGTTLTVDQDYPTQVNYFCTTPCLLTATPREMGPDADIAPGASFESFRVFELLLDSSERERRTLAQRRMYRALAPWTAESPFMFHKLGSDPKTVRDAIDQAAEAGFDVVIMSFGSGFNFESRDENYMARYKELADYGKSKGIALGGYSLLGSRGAAEAKDNTQGVPARFGVMPCLGARWGQDYLKQIRRMCEKTGLAVFENDGSYPGDRCAATDHPGHHGLADSQWVQWRAITGLVSMVHGQRGFPECSGLVCALGQQQDRHGLPRNELVAAAGGAGDHRAAEHVRRYLG